MVLQYNTTTIATSCDNLQVHVRTVGITRLQKHVNEAQEQLIAALLNRWTAFPGSRLISESTFQDIDPEAVLRCLKFLRE